MTKRRESLALWVALSRAYEKVAGASRRHAEARGLRVTEFGVLEALYHLGPMRLCDLRRKILVSSGGVTLVVDRLEGRGLVARVPDPADRRARLVELTPEGRRLIERIFPEHAEHIEGATAGLAGVDRKVAIRLLRRLAAESPEQGT